MATDRAVVRGLTLGARRTSTARSATRSTSLEGTSSWKAAISPPSRWRLASKVRTVTRPSATARSTTARKLWRGGLRAGQGDDRGLRHLRQQGAGVGIRQGGDPTVRNCKIHDSKKAAYMSLSRARERSRAATSSPTSRGVADQAGRRSTVRNARSTTARKAAACTSTSRAREPSRAATSSPTSSRAWRSSREATRPSATARSTTARKRRRVRLRAGQGDHRGLRHLRQQARGRGNQAGRRPDRPRLQDPRQQGSAACSSSSRARGPSRAATSSPTSSRAWRSSRAATRPSATARSTTEGSAAC